MSIYRTIGPLVHFEIVIYKAIIIAVHRHICLKDFEVCISLVDIQYVSNKRTGRIMDSVYRTGKD